MMITAHSGCDGTPDNTLAFVTYALSLSPDAIEVDVQRRSDNVLVIAHDDDPAFSFAGCPTLKEVFTLVAGHPGVAVNCDCKQPGMEADLAALHQACGLTAPLILTGMVSPAVMRNRSGALCAVQPFLNAEEIVPDFYERMKRGGEEQVRCAKQVADVCASCGAHVVNSYYEACTETFLKMLTAQGIGVSAWTVDDVATAQKLAALGIYNITTRSAKALLAALR